MRQASLSRQQFATAFTFIATQFQAKFGEPIVVTGRDHAEHVALYGPGGALDLRSGTMTPGEIGWLIDECHIHHIRVKDFSRDSVLRAQVEAAQRAGLIGREGTGLHLHIDRFAGRADQWTVPVLPSVGPGGASHQEELQARHPGEAELAAILQRMRLPAGEQLVVHVGAVEARIDQEEPTVLAHDRTVEP
jgi:hypothetical protein